MDKPYLIVSDIHGDASAMERIREAERYFDALAVFSAGDLCPDPYDPVFQGVLGVRGNCDRYCDYGNLGFPPLFLNKELFGRKVFMTHGDRYWTDDFPLEEEAVFISGHTHVPVLEKKDGVYFLNPGSASRPRSSKGPTFALFYPSRLVLLSLLDFSEISSLVFA